MLRANDRQDSGSDARQAGRGRLPAQLLQRCRRRAAGAGAGPGGMAWPAI